MSVPHLPSPGDKFWERLADKSIALLVAMVLLFVGFYYHKSLVEKLMDLLTQRVILRLERIERCACGDKK